MTGAREIGYFHSEGRQIEKLRDLCPDPLVEINPADAEKYGLENKQIVSVKASGTGRETIFGDVVVRVSEKFALAMHIDTDECNAAGISPNFTGEILD